MKFLVIGDLHYKKNMYAASVAHLEAVFHRAYTENVDFVIHTGDFCNDYIGSSELLRAYLNNKYGLPVFGIYGNHELESKNNNMSFVTPRLGNQKVNFGGEEVGYWYFDMERFRIIGLDTNYSYNEESNHWQHNLPASWGAPAGNKLEHSISPDQFLWLDKTICQASRNGQKVIVFSHAALSGQWHSSPDAESIRQLFQKYQHTVLMSINGHLHTDHFCIRDNVAYFDVNAAINGAWYPSQSHHYEDIHTFTREIVQEDGRISGAEEAKLTELSQGKNTWFFTEPLSAIVDVSDSGVISISGSQTSWMHAVAPPWDYDGMKPEIPDRTAKIT